MSISERLQMVIKMNGLSNTAFAERIGVQRSSISHVLLGRNKPSIDFIEKILNEFPKVNAGWLVTGRKVGKTQSEKQVEEQEQTSTISQPTNVAEKETNKGKPHDKSIDKIVIFYTDGTFEEATTMNK